MDRIPEKSITGAYAGKKEDCILRDKLNEVVDWINEMEQPTVEIEAIDEGLKPESIKVKERPMKLTPGNMHKRI